MAAAFKVHVRLRCLFARMILLLGSPARAASTDVVLNEILYNADSSNGGGEFVELHNRGAAPVELSGWTLGGGVSFTFPQGVSLPAKGYLVICRNEAQARAYYGVANVAGQYQGHLENQGEALSLKDGSGNAVDSVAYDDDPPWPPEADGGGPSLELIDPAGDNSRAGSWGIGQPYTPGRANRPGVPRTSGEVVITEIMYRPLRQEEREKFDAVNRGTYLQIGDDELGEYLELQNRGARLLDLSGWSFTQGISYLFPPGVSLAPGGRLVVAGDPAALRQRFGLRDVAGPFGGHLDNGGERLTLRDGAGALMNSVRYDDRHPWPIGSDEKGASLECIDPLAPNGGPENWRAGTVKLGPPPPAASEDGWFLVTAAGSATSTRLSLFLNGPGDWLVDEIEVRLEAGGENLLQNGSFDPDDSGWIRAGNHSGSFRTVQESRQGQGCERLAASGTGDGSANGLLSALIPGLEAGRNCTVSLWAKRLAGDQRLTVEIAGGGLRASATAPLLFDLSEEWSETQNPSGTWSLRSGSAGLIRGHLSSWLPGDLGANQPAWTDAGPAGIPGWAKGNGAYASGPHPEYDFPAGTIMSHGPSQVWWTAPSAGWAYVTGGVWLLRHIGRSQAWWIRKSGVILTGGDLVSGNLSAGSSTPRPFEAGRGGAGALGFPVAAGEAIQFGALPLEGGANDFVGYHIRVELRPGSTPSEEEPLPPPLGGVVGLGTPGEQNSVASTNLPPLVEELAHFPEIPTSREAVTVTAVVTDDDPLASVELETALGSSSASTRTPLFDDGAHGDGLAGDGVYGVVIPARPSHTLVHYRVHATDSQGASTSFPYDSDPSPTQAFCHYDHEVNTQLTFFDLSITPENLAKLNAAPRSPDYVDASVAIDGVAYPHVGVRYRGRGSRTHPKHPWKIHFNRDRPYRGNRVLDTMLQFPFEQWIAFQVFDAANITNLEGDLIRLHLNGQFWGVYVAFESPNASWLEKESLDPAGEIYKARTVETAGQSKNSDLFHNQIVTDHDYWGTWNKKVRPLEPPVHIRELTDALNDLPEGELLPWLEARVDLEQWFRRWSLYVLMNIDDFCGHNYYLHLPGGPGGKWQTLAYDFDSGFTFSRVGPLRALYGDGGSGDNPAWQRNRFYQRVSASRTLKRIYFLTLRRMLEEVYRLEEIFPEVDRLFALSAPDRALDIAKWGTMRGTTSELKSVATSQRNSIGSFLAAQGLPSKTQVVGFDPPAGKYPGPLSVKLLAPAGFTAVYTLDGSDPRLSASRKVYSGPLSLESPATVTAAALRGPLDLSGGDWSDLTRAAYDVGEPPGVFIRGDCNRDARVDIADALKSLLILFAAGQSAPCGEACDANADSQHDLSDAIYLLVALFQRGPVPPAPYPACGRSGAEGGCDAPACP